MRVGPEVRLQAGACGEAWAAQLLQLEGAHFSRVSLTHNQYLGDAVIKAFMA